MTPVLAAGRWRLVCSLVANGFGQAWAALGLAVLVRATFTEITIGRRPEPMGLAGIVVGFGVAMVVAAWLRARERTAAERLGQSYVHDVRLTLFDHLTAMSPRAVNERSTGSTALRFVGDLSAIRRWVSLGLARLLVAGTMIGATLVALWSIEPMLAAVTAAASVAAAATAVAIGPGLRSADREARRRRSRLAGRMTELITSVATVQASGAVARERKRVVRHSERVGDAMVARADHLGRLGAVAEASGVAAIAALLVGALVAGIDGPSVAAGMTVLTLLVPHLRGLARVQEYRQGAVVATRAIERFLARPARPSTRSDLVRLPDGPGLLELDGIGHGSVLSGLTATAPPGTTIAVIGRNGVGKSTLVSIVAGLLDADTGTVRLDGVEPRRLHPADLRRAVGLASPDLPLLRGSLRRNLTYRVPSADPAEVARVVEQCDLGDLLASLPDGLDTRIAEGGVDLSAGQRRRLQLARAVLASPRLLLLDEADVNLDHRTLEVVERLLVERSGTTLLVTHDARRLAVADEVWLLDEGRIVEAGPPAALLAGPSRTGQLFATGAGVR